MPKGIDVYVEDGFATLDFVDKDLRGPALQKLLDSGAPIETLTRSGPRRQYRVPEGNAREAGLLDKKSSGTEGSAPHRVDTGHAEALVNADPHQNSGVWQQPVHVVSDTAYTGGAGIISGPLRPNKPAPDPSPTSGVVTQTQVNTNPFEKTAPAPAPEPADDAPAPAKKAAAKKAAPKKGTAS